MRSNKNIFYWQKEVVFFVLDRAYNNFLVQEEKSNMTEKRHLRHHGNLYDLTPSEFEHLVVEIFAEYGYSDLKIVSGPAEQGFDIVGIIEGKPVAIEVKHKTSITLQEIKNIVDRYFSIQSNPRTFIFVTSADLPPNVSNISKEIPSGAELHIFGRQDIQKMFSRYSDIYNRFFGRAIRRLKSQNYRLILSIVISMFSVSAVFFSISSVFTHKAPLDKRIETVEKTLTSIRGLESYLVEIKQDMLDKEKTTEIINQKYAQAKELEKLTDAQLAALQSTLQKQNWRWTLFNYMMGFALGIASSFLASVLHAKWRQRKALE